ncbi:ATPase [Alsobacter soli]|uniref:ATPase n=1 Tax=Alsobacter soli TaxID=2109933 RepID=A0A2T1HMU0_9HYPH|nr:ATP12 family protein [Alsobacter soli]PSC02984.1 ATPase [Alsobacter soli]
MPDDSTTWFPDDYGVDPIRAARAASAATPLPRRFYKEAGVAETDGGFVLVLDGRPARTPAKSPLALPSRGAGEAVAAEWAAQGQDINPASMPLTRLVNTGLDGVARMREEVIDEIAKYAGTDLLCYRAGDPARLVQRQSDAWDPVLDWARDEIGARFFLAEGVMFAEQPASSLAAVRGAVAEVIDPIALAALSTMTSLTGSVLLALAVSRGRLSASEAWAAAHVDEDFQMEVWGADDEALERRARRWNEMEASATLFRLLHAP